MNQEYAKLLEATLKRCGYDPTIDKLAEAKEILLQGIRNEEELLVSVYKDEQDNVAVQMLVDQNNMQVISMFTSEEEAEKAWKTTTIELCMKSVMEAVLQSEGYDGFVINPFSEELQLYKPQIAELLEEA